MFLGRNTRGIVLAALAGLLLFPAAGRASFPGTNGKIAFTSQRDGNSEIYSMNADGSGVTRLTNDPRVDKGAAWSPDGQKILFVRGESPGYAFQIWSMNADGSGQTQLTTQGGEVPVWYPDGQSFEYIHSDSIHRRTLDGSSDVQLTTPNLPCETDPVSGYPEGTCDFNVDFDLSPDGTQLVVERDHDEYAAYPRYDLTSVTAYLSIGGLGAAPSWAPDQSRIAFNEYSWDEFDGEHSALGTVRPDGSDRVILRDGAVGAAWSPDGTKIAFVEGSRIKLMNPDGTNITDVGEGYGLAWQPIPINAYARPKGATPMRLSLVPGQKQCTSPNNTHGAPLSFGSCSPPELTSGQLTTGTPDSNGKRVTMDAYLELRAIAGNPSTAADEADVSIAARVNDVLNKDLSDYTGSLRANLPLRITDKDNTPSPGGPGAGTTVPFQFGFDLPCASDPDPQIGSDCSVNTTADALFPGTIKESRRTIWQVGRARVDDGGSDGDGSTTADNTVFAVQGIFIP